MTLEVTNLCCIRGERSLFSSVSFTLQNKQILYVEGQNGTGKTTLLRTICGLFEAEEGEVRWQGKTIKKQDEAFRKELLYLGHSNAIKGDFSALENLRQNCGLSGHRYSEDILLDALDEIGLFGFEYLPTRQLSQGQKRRVALAALLLSQSSFWVLDEPFVALDAAAVELLQTIISTHVAAGGIVILTTHQEVPLTSGEVLRLNLDKMQKAEATNA